MKNGLEIAGLGIPTLKNIDMTLAPGQCAGISGPSGSGKTLMLRAVADLDPHEGNVWLDGVAAESMAPHLWRQQVALMPAETAWWHDTVGPHFKTVSETRLATLGFARDVLDWQISRLSSGERQRLGVLRMLMLEPGVLLLDEPTANLDAENARLVESLIEQYRRDHQPVILWVSHDMNQLQRNCTLIFMIKKGRLVVHSDTASSAGGMK